VTSATEGRVSLLRGINVGGNHQIPMVRLRLLYQALGFEAVSTYIQSGNVVFRTARGAADRSLVVEAAIVEAFGWPIRAVERTHAELAEIVAEDPFPGADPKTRLVTFLVDPPTDRVRTDFARVTADGDSAILVGRQFHLHCPGGLGRSTLPKVLADRRLGVATTTRNWRTVNTLAALTD
jgi:uncharacterized protein (DUF1697 family)